MVEQIVDLLKGLDPLDDAGTALVARVVTEIGTNPLTTFVTLLVQEEKTQAAQDSRKLPANVVDDSQCKR